MCDDTTRYEFNVSIDRSTILVLLLLKRVMILFNNGIIGHMIVVLYGVRRHLM